MSLVQTAEAKVRARAFAMLFFALSTAGILIFDLSPLVTDFTRGLWVGLTFTSTLILLPFRRWLAPESQLQRMLDDEGTQMHRRLACMAGFWAAIIAALVLSILDAEGIAMAVDLVIRVITTAAVATALGRFALLELRAGQ